MMGLLPRAQQPAPEPRTLGATPRERMATAADRITRLRSRMMDADPDEKAGYQSRIDQLLDRWSDAQKEHLAATSLRTDH